MERIAREAEIDCPPAGRVKLKIVDRPNSRSFKMWADSPHSAVVSKPPRAPLKDALSFARSNAGWLAEALANFSEPVPGWAAGSIARKGGEHHRLNRWC